MNVPKIRFNDFYDNISKISIKELGNVITGTTPSTADRSNYGDEYLWASPVDMGDFKYINNTKTKLSEKGFNKTRCVPKDSILITCIGSTIGKTGMASKEMSTNQQINTLIPNKNYNSDYLYYCINFNFPRFLNKISFQAVPIISKSEFEKLEVNITKNIYEQEKIGNMLSLIDKKIELQSKKIEDLKLFKKGLINKELNNLNDCKSISLNELGTTYSGLYGKTKEDFENGNCKFINFMSVLKDNIDVSSLTTVKINPNEKQNKVEKGDLFFMTSSETKEEVALCSTLSYDVKNLYLNSFCFGYRINNLNLINNEYLNCLLHSPKYRKQISNLGQGFTRVNISKNKLLELLVEVPDMKQQIRIVSINNKINYKINSEINKLNKLNELKKGLMQNMFV